MRFDILTLFPGMFSSPFQESILGRAIEKGFVQIRIVNIRDFALDKHQVVDDTPYGGGQGMVMKVEPIARAIERLKSEEPSARVIYLTPQGRPFNQKRARELSSLSHLILLCGRYEGIDDRVRELFVDEEISIGDYVLTGGELAAMVVIDASREAFTRVFWDPIGPRWRIPFLTPFWSIPSIPGPIDFRGRLVPEVLLSGKSPGDFPVEAEGGPKADMDPATGPPGTGRSQSGRSKTLGGDREGALRIARGWVKHQNPNRSRAGMNGTGASNLYIGLVHHPVYDKRKEVVASAVTNFDIHDIARCARTFGLGGFFVITPLESQVQLTERIIRHWVEGAGALYNSTRKESLSLVQISRSIDEADRKLDRPLEEKGEANCDGSLASS